jgi:hypothetical protein
MTNKPVSLLVPDPFLRAVGLVVTQWAWAEAILDQCIWRLLGVRAARGRIITSNLPARIKIETLTALLRKSRFDESFVWEIENEGKALADLRNLVAHGYIAVQLGHDTGVILAASAKGELKDRSRRITAPLLEVLGVRIGAYVDFLCASSPRLPKQRGLQRALNLLNPKRRRHRPDTIARRRAPLLVVERPKDQTYEAQQVARAAKLAKKRARDEKSQQNHPKRP